MKIEIDADDLMSLKKEIDQLRNKCSDQKRELDKRSDEEVSCYVSKVVNESVKQAFDKVFNELGFNLPHEKYYQCQSIDVGTDWKEWYKKGTKIKITPQIHFYEDVKQMVLKITKIYINTNETKQP